MSSQCLRMICLFVLVSGNRALAQGDIDSLITTLHNTDAVSVIAWVAPKKTFDSGKIYAHTIERILTGVDIDRIEKTYPKYLLVTKLVQALDDTSRDWYADLLLYRLTLTEILSINIIGCETRQKWLLPKRETNKTYKEADIEMWHKYLAGLSNSSSW